MTDKYRWYVLLLLTLSFATNIIDRTAWYIAQEHIKTEFGFSDADIGLLGGLAFGGAYALFAIPLGLLADRVSRRLLLAAIMAIWSASTALSALSTGFMGFLIPRMLTGASESGLSPTATSLFSDLFPPKKRGAAASIFHAGPALGGILSFLVGGYVVAQYGWRALFLLAGAPGLLLSVAVLLTVREPARTDAAEAPRGGHFASLRSALLTIVRSPRLRWTFLGVMFATMGVSSLSAWSVSFMVRIHDLGVRDAGVWGALCTGVLGIIGALTGGPLAAHLARNDPRNGLRFSALVVFGMAFAALAFVSSASLAPAMAGFAVYGLLHLAFVGPAFGVILNEAAPQLRGVTIAMLQILVNFIGGGLGPFAVGLISDAVAGPDALRQALMICVPEFLLGGLIILIASLRMERQPAVA